MRHTPQQVLIAEACCMEQAKLKLQQAALKARLQQALQMTTLPQTNIDTVTVADKAVHLLDLMIEVDCTAPPSDLTCHLILHPSVRLAALVPSSQLHANSLGRTAVCAL